MPQRTYKAVFFDLDGTLLPIDMDGFLECYFKTLAGYAAAHGMEAERFVNALSQGVQSMVKEEGGLNSERFWRTFHELYPGDRAKHEAIVNGFYETAFDELGSLVAHPAPEAAQVVNTLKAKGYPLYLTTMPLFPRVAVEKRLGWAGVPVEAFDRITVYDNSTTVKPNVAYYRENVEAIGLVPEDILMVGNNTREDLAALQLGCDGYLVTDWLLDPDGYDISTVKHGTLAEFAQFVDELPECE